MSVRALGVLDDLLLRAQFVAVPWIKGRSWRSGMAAERLVQSVHERLRRTARRAGWIGRESLHPAGDAEPQCVLPPYPDFVPRVAGVCDTARLLVSGTWRRIDGTIGAMHELSWLHDGYGDTSSLDRLDFHSLRWAVDLFDAFDATKESSYLDAGLSLVGRWIDECLDCEDARNVWSDHATALRAIVLCQAWHRGGKRLDSAASRKLREAAARHAHKLAFGRFYRPDHDHGVTQSYAQLALGLCFAQAAAPAWVAQGLARLECQMQDNVTGGGILKEHSPYYQLYVLQQFYYAYEVGRSAGVAFSRQYADRLRHMAEAATGTMKPDGTLPAFGDTSKASPIVIDPSSVLTALGATDLGADTGRRVWTEGGYALFRSGRNPAERPADERFVMVRCGNFPMPHLHDDLLSFEFYAWGDDLVVDSGGPFQYAHPARTGYFTRVAAHNTIAIEGAAEGAVGSARIICCDSLPEGDVFVAERTAAPGVVHTRALCFVHSGYLVLIDTITSRAPRTIRSFLHLNPALEAILEGGSLRTRRSSDGPRVSVVPLHGSTVTASLARGERTPLQGWICTGMGLMTPGSVLEYRGSGTEVMLASVIAVEKQPGSKVTATLSGNLEEFSGRIAVDCGDRRDEIVLSRPWRIRIERNVASGLVS